MSLALLYCPRCGAENEAGNRYCIGCGSELPVAGEKAKPPVSATPRQRLGRLVGTTRKARLLSAATLAALVIAVIAFLALKPSATHDQTHYTEAADRICVEQKRRITALEAETIKGQTPNLEAFASVLVTIVAEWRSNLPAPTAADQEGASELDLALQKALIAAGAMARAARAGEAGRTVAAAKQVDIASQGIDKAAADLGLEECQKLSVGPASTSQP